MSAGKSPDKSICEGPQPLGNGRSVHDVGRERVNTRVMSDEILVDADGPVTTTRLHRTDELPALAGRELTGGVVGDIVGVRLAEFG